MRNKLLFLVLGITFLGLIDTMMLVPIMRLYADGLGATATVAGLIIGIYSITNTPANVFLGPIVDKVGRKVPLLIGLVGDASCMFLYSLCTTPMQLMLLRGLHGLSGAVLGLATASLVADYSPPGGKGRGMSFYSIAMGMASFIGMMACGIVMGKGQDVNFVFYAGGAMLIIAVGLTLFLPKAEAKSKSAGINFRMIGIVSRKKANIASYSAVFSQWFVMGIITVLLPIYVVNLGMTAFHVSMVMAAASAACIIFNYPAGVMADRIGRKIPAIAGLAFLIVAINLYPLATNFRQLIEAGVIQGMGMGLILPSALAILTDNTRKGERGTAMGIFHALVTLGVAAGAPIAGVLAQWFGNDFSMRLSTVVPLAALFTVMIFVKTGLPQKETTIFHYPTSQGREH
ncbi:MAG: MFS transporter [Dehalococcoidia bacterium]|nr:MFS transporter [Dehalococcoidia bacterium]